MVFLELSRTIPHTSSSSHITGQPKRNQTRKHISRDLRAPPSSSNLCMHKEKSLNQDTHKKVSRRRKRSFPHNSDKQNQQGIFYHLIVSTPQQNKNDYQEGLLRLLEATTIRSSRPRLLTNQNPAARSHDASLLQRRTAPFFFPSLASLQ